MTGDRPYLSAAAASRIWEARIPFRNMEKASGERRSPASAALEMIGMEELFLRADSRGADSRRKPRMRAKGAGPQLSFHSRTSSPERFKARLSRSLLMRA